MAYADNQTNQSRQCITDPWFHSGMTRDKAIFILHQFRAIDGVYLVRESESNPGSFVLTYTFSNTVLHAHINPIWDDPLSTSACPLYSLDNGATRFYNIKQLCNFYRINLGFLPTKLTNYVVYTPYPSLAEQEQRSSAFSGGSNNQVGNCFLHY